MAGVATFLRWAGSKRQLLPKLAESWDCGFERYVEPFAGSACLFFFLRPPAALLGDVNADLIGTYNAVKDSAQTVATYLAKYRGGKDEYYSVRALDPVEMTPAARAARFIYLNRYCFNGLYRTNHDGRFNVPYGGEKSGDLPTITELRDASELLAHAELVAGDFARTLDEVRLGDFVYLDPPYSVQARRVFNEYDRSAFSPDDLERLKSWLTVIDSRGARFLVSYAKSKEATVLAAGYYTKCVRVRRNIAGFARKRRTYLEVLISNHPFASKSSRRSK